MSYCRIGEFGSDVYVIRSGDRLVCFCGIVKSFECETEQDMIDHLLTHRQRGEIVPKRAITRLEHERDGLPYKTDVQRALDSLRLDAIGVESVKTILNRGLDEDNGP